MTDNSGYYVKQASTDKQKIEEVRRIFGAQAEDVLQKCGTLAYDYMYNNMKENYYEYSYTNNDELFNKIKKTIVSSKAEDLVPYVHNRQSRTFDWNTRCAEVNAAKQKYTVFREKEIAEKNAAERAATPEVSPKLKDFLKRTIGSDDLASSLTAKYGEKAYAVALSAVMEPGVMVEELGVKIDGKFSSKNLLETLAKNETQLDAAKLTSFLDGYAQRKSGREQANQVKQELKNQRTLAELKPVVLDEVVVIAKAPEKNPLASVISKLDIKLDNLKLAEIKIKSPAEQKYDEMLAKKTAKMPDELMGKKGTEIGLTVGELMKLGVNPRNDFDTIIKNMNEQDRAAAEALIPKGGFTDKDVVVSKELAIKAIALSQYRNAQKNRGKQRA